MSDQSFDGSEKFTIWKYSKTEASWAQLEDLPLKYLYRMAVVDGELLAFHSSDEIYVLREGAWQKREVEKNLAFYGLPVVLPRGSSTPGPM